MEKFNKDDLQELFELAKGYEIIEEFIIERNNTNLELNLPLTKENNIIKTGLYVKDKINGIGTITYIDPTTKIYGSLGHEIVESKTLSKFEIKDGNIYDFCKWSPSHLKKDILNISYILPLYLLYVNQKTTTFSKIRLLIDGYFIDKQVLRVYNI